MTVAVAGAGAVAEPGTIHQVTFGGSTSFQIPPGAQVLSDPVDMWAQPLEDLAVSVYLPDKTGSATFHSDAQQVNWISTVITRWDLGELLDKLGDLFAGAVEL